MPSPDPLPVKGDSEVIAVSAGGEGREMEIELIVLNDELEVFEPGAESITLRVDTDVVETDSEVTVLGVNTGELDREIDSIATGADKDVVGLLIDRELERTEAGLEEMDSDNEVAVLSVDSGVEETGTKAIVLEVGFGALVTEAGADTEALAEPLG